MTGVPFGNCKPCKGLGYVPRDPMPKGVKNGVAICLACNGQGETKGKGARPMTNTDKALAIGEDAFKAGFEYALKKCFNAPSAPSIWPRLIAEGWSDYEPSEDIKALADDL